MLATQRRIQGLVAIGWRIVDIAAASGRPERSLHRAARGERPRVSPGFANDVEHAAHTLLGRVPKGPHVERVRRNAARRGWVPLHAWENLDDPTAQPRKRAKPDPTCVDWVAVELAVDGHRVPLTRAGRVAAIQRIGTASAASRRLGVSGTTARLALSGAGGPPRHRGETSRAAHTGHTAPGGCGTR